MILELCSIALVVAVAGVVYYRLKHRKDEETYIDGSTLTYDDVGYPPLLTDSESFVVNERQVEEPVVKKKAIAKRKAPKKTVSKKTAPKKRGRPAKKPKN